MYIIEHLEQRMWHWCIIEYKHISKIVGRKNIWFTNIRRCKELQKYGSIISRPARKIDLKNACVLDPDADKILTPLEAKGFDYFIFGGILGDFPAKKRTKSMLSSKLSAEKRNIGKRQMSTDNAVYVVKQIRSGIPLEHIKFKQGIEIHTGKNESVRMPYRYAVVDNKPLISPELISYLKRKRGF
jgi:ribosome biogenesis SPOUT family RNA methylase Rps3